MNTVLLKALRRKKYKKLNNGVHDLTKKKNKNRKKYTISDYEEDTLIEIDEEPKDIRTYPLFWICTILLLFIFYIFNL